MNEKKVFKSFNEVKQEFFPNYDDNYKKCPYCGSSGCIRREDEFDGRTPEECAKIITDNIFSEVRKELYMSHRSQK